MLERLWSIIIGIKKKYNPAIKLRIFTSNNSGSRKNFLQTYVFDLNLDHFTLLNSKFNLTFSIELGFLDNLILKNQIKGKIIKICKNFS